MFQQPSPTEDPDGELEARLEADRRHDRLVELAEYEVFKREARRLADALEKKDDRKPEWLSLTEQLSRPLNEQVFSIDELLPLGGNALFAGRYKAGKTTFNGQLLKAWADGEPFLGMFDIAPDPDRPNVTIFNYEMSEDQFHRWLKQAGIVNTDKVNIVHLRGMYLPLELHEVRVELARRLADARTGLWIVDPASRAFGGDVTSNGEVTAWLAHLDEVKLNGNVRDLVLNIHMPHAANANSREAQERAIGAQAWSAWADALWFLNFDKEHNRQFWASGRDVEFDKRYVHYDESNRSVMLLPDAPRHDDPDVLDDQMRGNVIRVIENNDGISQAGIHRELRALGLGGRTEAMREAVQSLIDEEYVVLGGGGRGKATSHHLSTEHPWIPGTSPTSPQPGKG